MLHMRYLLNCYVMLIHDVQTFCLLRFIYTLHFGDPAQTIQYVRRKKIRSKYFSVDR